VPAVIVRRAPIEGWRSKIGLGVRGTGAIQHDGWQQLGIGGELLLRVSPHLVTELAAEYQKAVDNTPSAIDRMDVPVTFGLRMHIGRPSWWVSPYFVVAAGVVFASQDLKVTDDFAFYFDAQLGGGLEVRLGQHVALTFDARLDARKRANDPSAQVASLRSVDGRMVRPLDDEIGGQFRAGAAVYF
jgi:hypothetical protein